MYACAPTYILEVTMHSVTYVRVTFLLTHSSKGHQRSFEEEAESKRKSKGIRNGNELDGLHLTLAAKVAYFCHFCNNYSHKYHCSQFPDCCNQLSVYCVEWN